MLHYKYIVIGFVSGLLLGLFTYQTVGTYLYSTNLPQTIVHFLWGSFVQSTDGIYIPYAYGKNYGYYTLVLSFFGALCGSFYSYILKRRNKDT